MKLKDSAKKRLEATEQMAKDTFAVLTDEQRLEIMREYCRYCGVPFKDCAGEVCHCENDE